jgi:pyruvate/2-oxoglutarate/acetoin dehydrogenase E1 component
MAKPLRETIKEIIRTHLKKKRGIVMGQCLTAVGWVGGTLPELYEKDGMIELSMADVAGGGIVVGAALMGKKPIYIIRYQGFNWYNAPMIVNYACKSKEIWKVPCPMLIRGIGMEGGIGPVAGSSHHSIYFRMPGVTIFSPMSPGEYKFMYNHFIKNEEVVYASEHRSSFGNTQELPDRLNGKCDIIIFAISITRFEVIKVQNILKKQKITVGIANIFWIKPFKIKNSWIEKLKTSKYGGLVLDDDYDSGIAKSIANDLSLKSGKKIFTMGLKNKSAGFSKQTDNLPPNSTEIIKKVNSIIHLLVKNK